MKRGSDKKNVDKKVRIRNIFPLISILLLALWPYKHINGLVINHINIDAFSLDKNHRACNVWEFQGHGFVWILGINTVYVGAETQWTSHLLEAVEDVSPQTSASSVWAVWLCPSILWSPHQDLQCRPMWSVHTGQYGCQKNYILKIVCQSTDTNSTDSTCSSQHTAPLLTSRWIYII